MALKAETFDFDAVRRSVGDRRELDVGFLFMGERFCLATEPLLGDTFDLADAPEHEIGDNDVDTIRVVCRFIRSMVVEDQRDEWDDAVRRLPASQAFHLTELLTWVTKQVTTFPTLPPADSSVGRESTGKSSTRRTRATKA